MRTPTPACSTGDLSGSQGIPVLTDHPSRWLCTCHGRYRMLLPVGCTWYRHPHHPPLSVAGPWLQWTLTGRGYPGVVGSHLLPCAGPPAVSSRCACTTAHRDSVAHCRTCNVPAMGLL